MRRETASSAAPQRHHFVAMRSDGHVLSADLAPSELNNEVARAYRRGAVYVLVDGVPCEPPSDPFDLLDRAHLYAPLGICLLSLCVGSLSLLILPWFMHFGRL